MKNFLLNEIDSTISALDIIEKSTMRLTQRLAIEKSISRLQVIRKAVLYILPN